MRIWCVPSATELESSPKLPPRIDRDVFLRSPPPPPRLSKEQKLARGVIVVNKNRHKKLRKASSSSSSKSTLDDSGSSLPLPPPPPLRVSKNGSVLGTSSSSNRHHHSSRNSRNQQQVPSVSSRTYHNNNQFKAHINNGGSVTSGSIILHPGTSRTRQKKIKKRKRGKHWKLTWKYVTLCWYCKIWSSDKTVSFYSFILKHASLTERFKHTCDW